MYALKGALHGIINASNIIYKAFK